jgi:hypothetical protein
LKMARRPKPKPSHQLIDDVVERARQYVGYTARPNKITQFGERLNLNGLPWDGAFIETVLRETGVKDLAARDGRRPLPSMTYTPTALSYFIKTARVFSIPKRGDIVFFQFSTVEDFGMPHVGIVTDVGADGAFTSVEAMVSSGTPRGPQSNDGVHERQRHAIDTVAFGRIDYRQAASVARRIAARDARVLHIAQTGDGERGASGQSSTSRSPLLTVSVAQTGVGSSSKRVETVQLALHVMTGVEGMKRGKFCALTQIAFANFQRSLGYPNSSATGVPDATSLKRLAEMSRVFDFKS